MKKPQGRPPKLIQVGWRVPTTMRDKLRRDARRLGVSVNTLVVARLAKAQMQSVK